MGKQQHIILGKLFPLDITKGAWRASWWLDYLDDGTLAQALRARAKPESCPAISALLY